MNLLALPLGEVHVWPIELDRHIRQMEELHASLSEDEQRRAARFRFPQDRDRWIAAHSLLRVILSCYLETRPELLRFALGPYGKPALIGDSLQFNLSHSDRMALIAVAKHGEVGVDIERRRSNFSPEELARQFFSPAEQAVLLSLPSDQRHEFFFTLWTGKEAYVKARGTGLSFPLAQLTLRPDTNTPTLWAEDASSDHSHPPISLTRLNISENYAAALAFEGSLTAIRLLA